MTNFQFPITGMQHQLFDDGVDMVIYYTRDDTNIKIINSIRIMHDLCTTEQTINLPYDDFLRVPHTIIMGKKVIDLLSRVEGMVNSVEQELEMAESLLTSPRFSFENNNTDIFSVDGDALTLDVDIANGTHLPEPGVFDGDDPTHLDGEISNIRIYNQPLSPEEISRLAVPDNNPTSKPATPKRKRTRWELLELD